MTGPPETPSPETSWKAIGMNLKPESYRLDTAVTP